jgi:hypothetical protein
MSNENSVMTCSFGASTYVISLPNLAASLGKMSGTDRLTASG